jgi:hypothetical protein
MKALIIPINLCKRLKKGIISHQIDYSIHVQKKQLNWAFSPPPQLHESQPKAARTKDLISFPRRNPDIIQCPTLRLLVQHSSNLCSALCCQSVAIQK